MHKKKRRKNQGGNCDVFLDIGATDGFRAERAIFRT